MSDDLSGHVTAWAGHIHALAGDIGPRGSTTQAERRAAEYCERILAGLGCQPRVEGFTSARSAFQVHLLVGVGMLLSFALYPLRGRASAGLAAGLAVLSLACECLEMLFRDNPYRRLIAKGPSQNVYATLPHAAEHRADLVLMGHVDSQRAALIFKNNRWTDRWRVFGPLAFFTFCAQALLYGLGAATRWPWIWPVTLPGALCAALLVSMCAQADLSPYSPGANDNASGAGLVLALAAHLRREPLRHTRVWLVCTGCEEVKHYGAIDFYARHRAELHNPAALVFETLGRAGPAWIEREHILPPFPYTADPGLSALAAQLASDHPEWRAHPTRVLGAHTEMADALRLDIPAITFIGLAPGGVPIGYDGPELYWHRIDDTYDKIDHAVLERAYHFTWAYIQALDARAGAR